MLGLVIFLLIGVAIFCITLALEIRRINKRNGLIFGVVASIILVRFLKDTQQSRPEVLMFHLPQEPLLKQDKL